MNRVLLDVEGTLGKVCQMIQVEIMDPCTLAGYRSDCDHAYLY